MAWKAGESGNPGGRPRGAAGLAAYIREQTDDLRELVTIALTIARSTEAKDRDRVAAVQLVLDRALGKPHTTLSIDADLRHDMLDLLAMTTEQRARRIQELQERRKQLEAHNRETGDDK